MRASKGRRLARWVTAALVLVASAAGAVDGPLKVFSSGAVAGTGIVVKNKLLDASTASVTVGGEPVTVLARHHHRVRIVVPEHGPGTVPVVATSGNDTFHGQLLIVPPFDGSVVVTPDEDAAAGAVVGPDGGTIVATDSSDVQFELEIPAGALTSDTAITMTPAASIDGLPLAGPAAAVDLEPDGLEFAVPATLRITFPDKPPRHPLAFGYEAGGGGFTIDTPIVVGSTLEIPVVHFSDRGGSGSRAENMANLIAAELDHLKGKDLTIGETEELAGLIFQWLDIFGERMCEGQVQPICIQGANRVLESVRDLLAERCPAPPATPPAPTLGLVFELLRIENVRVQLADRYGGSIVDMPDAGQCIESIYALLVTRAVNAFVLFPVGDSLDEALAASSDGDELDGFPQQKTVADVDGDGTVSNAEWLIYLSISARDVAPVPADNAFDAFVTTMETVLEDGKHTCTNDYEDGLELLQRGAAIAFPFDLLVVEYTEAGDECAQIKVTPAAIKLAPGATTDFEATVNYEDSPHIHWSVTGGTINDSGMTGHYTAPTGEGEYTVTATDVLYPDTKGKATVVVCGTAPNDAPGMAAAGEDQCLADVFVRPASVKLGPGQSWQFAATVFDVTDPRVTWSATGGTINDAGLYTAGQTPGTYTVTATSVEDPAKKASATVAIVTTTGHLEIYSRFAIVHASGNCPESDVQYLPPDPFAARHPAILGNWNHTASSCEVTATQNSTVDARPDGTAWFDAVLSGTGGSVLDVEFSAVGDPVLLTCSGSGTASSNEGLFEALLYRDSTLIETFFVQFQATSLSIAINRELEGGSYRIYLTSGNASLSLRCNANAPVVASPDDD